MRLLRIILLGLMLLPLPAAAQQPGAQAGTGIPEALRGVWFAGNVCEAPAALLFLTARAALRVPAEGAPVLRRFATIAIAPGGWTLGTAAGAEAPRFGFRSPGPDRLVLLEPAAKTRDDQLPGEGAVQSPWRRCPAMPPALALRYGEAIDALLMHEQVEAACTAVTEAAECLASLVTRLDITGDGLLSVAELARFGRGTAQLAALQSGAAVAAGASASALAAARLMVDGLDYNGDGKLSRAELLQDRAGLGATPAAGGRLESLSAVPGLDALWRPVPPR
jgi:hypothetical protein